MSGTLGSAETGFYHGKPGLHKHDKEARYEGPNHVEACLSVSHRAAELVGKRFGRDLLIEFSLFFFVGWNKRGSRRILGIGRHAERGTRRIGLDGCILCKSSGRVRDREESDDGPN